MGSATLALSCCSSHELYYPNKSLSASRIRRVSQLQKETDALRRSAAALNEWKWARNPEYALKPRIIPPAFQNATALSTALVRRPARRCFETTFIDDFVRRTFCVIDPRHQVIFDLMS